jgi:hypothetical protein
MIAKPFGTSKCVLFEKFVPLCNLFRWEVLLMCEEQKCTWDTSVLPQPLISKLAVSSTNVIAMEQESVLGVSRLLKHYAHAYAMVQSQCNEL